MTVTRADRERAQELVGAIRRAVNSGSREAVAHASSRVFVFSRSVRARVLISLLQDPDADGYVRYDDGLVVSLLKSDLPLVESDVSYLLERYRPLFTRYHDVIQVVERFIEREALTPELTQRLSTFREAMRLKAAPWAQPELEARIARLLGEPMPDMPLFELADAQPWVATLLAELSALDPSDAQLLVPIVAHATTARASRPSTKWMKEAARLTAGSRGALFLSSALKWLPEFDRPVPEAVAEGWYEDEWAVPYVNGVAMRGLLWMSTLVVDPRLIRAVGLVGLSGQRKIPEVGARDSKVTNAAIWALGNTDHPLAIAQLAILRSKIRNRSVQKQVDKAMALTADRIGISEAELEELAVPSFGLTDVGALDVSIGEFTAELRITGTSKTEIAWRRADGKRQRTVPKAVKECCADALRELKATAKDIEKLLPVQRDRIDMLHLRQRSWPAEQWRERYLDHVLVGTLARRMIWRFGDRGGSGVRSAAWADGGLVDSSGAPVEVRWDRDHVSLWHPIGAPEDEIFAWRRFFEEREVAQPFKQGHREVYLLTDAERTTRIYSNRFAAHIIKQHQFNALCSVRGWRNSLRMMVDDSYLPARIDLPAWNLRAEFWVEGIGDDWQVDTTDSGAFLYLVTDQVRFYPLDAAMMSAHASGGGYGAFGEAAVDPIPLEDVDPLVLSEVMRDVDMFVGVASVGNDPTWADGGGDEHRAGYWHSYSFGDLSANATTRRELLQRLVPMLRISDRCSFEERFLVIRGEIRTYRIHLGSGNILMEPDNAYLCIVPSRGAVKGPAAKVFLPFEGDRTLSLILSKAFLLAEDRKITDPTIVTQIRRG